MKITAVEYKEAFGKLAVTMETQDGKKHIERFQLLDKDGAPNTGAYNAFSFFAKTALNDMSLSEIDHEDLVGCYLDCLFEHETVDNKNKPGQTVTFARIVEKSPSAGWDEDDEEEDEKPNGTFDLKKLLG